MEPGDWTRSTAASLHMRVMYESIGMLEQYAFALECSSTHLQFPRRVTASMRCRRTVEQPKSVECLLKRQRDSKLGAAR